MARLSSLLREKGRRVTRIFLMAMMTGLVPTATFAAWTGPIAGDIWAIRPTAKETRWLVIHDRESAQVEGLFHVEVLVLGKGAEPWRVRHVAKHMALTEEALRASIIKPLKRGAVYPESFDDAYAKWKEQSKEGRALICRSEVLACL